MKEYNTTYQYDIVRGIMCFMIFNRHFFNLFSNLPPIPRKIIGWFSDSQIALFYFFMLSGLVITLSFQRKDEYPTLYYFTIKRIFRLFPVVVLAILLGLIVCESGWLFFMRLSDFQPMTNWTLSLYNFDSSLLLAVTDIFNTLFCGFSYYDANFWTISYELYVPILILILLKWLPNILSVKILSILVFLAILLLGIQKSTLYMNTVYVLCFLIGCGIALFGNRINIDESKMKSILFFVIIVCFFLPQFIYFRFGNPLRLIGVTSLLLILSKHELQIIKRMNKIRFFSLLGGGKF